MSNTRNLPTDKFGNVYYGPRTFAEADEKITNMIDHGIVLFCVFWVGNYFGKYIVW